MWACEHTHINILILYYMKGGNPKVRILDDVVTYWSYIYICREIGSRSRVMTKDFVWVGFRYNYNGSDILLFTFFYWKNTCKSLSVTNLEYYHFEWFSWWYFQLFPLNCPISKTSSQNAPFGFPPFI